MINGQLYTPECIRQIESGIDPDETCIAACDFTALINQNPFTLVLTNRQVRFMGFRFDWRGKNPQLVGNTAIAVRTITGISTSEGKARLFAPYLFHLQFWWDRHHEMMYTRAIADGKAFAKQLSEVVAARDTTPNHRSVADEIQKLAILTKEGILTQEEWLKAKDHLIGSSPSQVDEAAKLLRHLHALHVQGVLSESEFNMKKWDVLSQRLISRPK